MPLPHAKAQQLAVDLYATTHVGSMGDVVNIQVKTNKFTNIISFQASLNWDPTLLAFINVADFGIKDFSDQSFGTSNASQGHIRFVWEPSDANPVTFDDSTVLFTAQFEIISDQPQEAPIGFSDIISIPPFPVEFANGSYEILEVNLFDGNITITNNLANKINVESIPNTSCDAQNASGSLKADVSGDSLNYIFQWYYSTEIGSSPNYTGYRYDNILPGVYTLQVLDLNKNILVESFAASVADNPVDIELAFSTKSNNFCEEKVNGSAQVSIVNSAPVDPRYYWFFENDQIDTTNAKMKGASFDSLSAGGYKAWVIDLNSKCYTTDVVLINDSLIYSDANITQRNDTLFANVENATWYRNSISLNANGLYIVPETSGNYSISITNDYGCISESEDLYFGITGIDEAVSGVSIYPNPFNNYIRITNQDGILDFIKIFTPQGVLIHENYNIKEKFTDIPLTGSTNGIYLLKIGKGAKIFTPKVVKNLSK